MLPFMAGSDEEAKPRQEHSIGRHRKGKHKPNIQKTILL